MEKSIRMGFFVSLLFVVIIRIVALIMQKKVWGKRESILNLFVNLLWHKSPMVFHTTFSFKTLGQGFIGNVW